MPKKNLESDSDSSDSGPDDRNPPPSKKARESNSSSSAKSSKSSKSNKGETRWVLEKLRFVNINEFRGRKMVDIREFYEKDGDHLPGKKGISLSIAQWKKLLEIADEVNAALED